MRTTLRRVHREQSGLVGKIIVVWLVFVAVIGIFAIDAASVLFTKFRLSDAAAGRPHLPVRSLPGESLLVSLLPQPLLSEVSPGANRSLD